MESGRSLLASIYSHLNEPTSNDTAQCRWLVARRTPEAATGCKRKTGWLVRELIPHSRRQTRPLGKESFTVPKLAVRRWQARSCTTTSGFWFLEYRDADSASYAEQRCCEISTKLTTWQTCDVISSVAPLSQIVGHHRDTGTEREDSYRKFRIGTKSFLSSCA